MPYPNLESVAKVLVITKKREALILTIGAYLRHPEKSFTPDLPGGMVDPGESELIAVVRELREETGIELEPDQFALAYAKTEFIEERNKSASKFLYIANVDEAPAVTLSWEHAEYNWVPLDVLMDTVAFRPFYDEAIRYCFKNGLI